jgi:hypothetical protein
VHLASGSGNGNRNAGMASAHKDLRAAKILSISSVPCGSIVDWDIVKTNMTSEPLGSANTTEYELQLATQCASSVAIKLRSENFCEKTAETKRVHDTGVRYETLSNHRSKGYCARLLRVPLTTEPPPISAYIDVSIVSLNSINRCTYQNDSKPLLQCQPPFRLLYTGIRDVAAVPHGCGGR